MTTAGVPKYGPVSPVRTPCPLPSARFPHSTDDQVQLSCVHFFCYPEPGFPMAMRAGRRCLFLTCPARSPCRPLHCNQDLLHKHLWNQGEALPLVSVPFEHRVKDTSPSKVHKSMRKCAWSPRSCPGSPRLEDLSLLSLRGWRRGALVSWSPSQRERWGPIWGLGRCDERPHLPTPIHCHSPGIPASRSHLGSRCHPR